MANDLDKQTEEAFPSIRNEDVLPPEAVARADDEAARARDFDRQNISEGFGSGMYQGQTDRISGMDEWGRPVYESLAGPDYTVGYQDRLNLGDAKTAVKNWREAGYPLPSAEQVADVAKGLPEAVYEPFYNVSRNRGSIGDVTEVATGVGGVGAVTGPVRGTDDLGIFGRLGSKSKAADPGFDAAGNKLPVSRGFDRTSLRFEIDDSTSTIRPYGIKILDVDRDWEKIDFNLEEDLAPALRSYSTLEDVLDHDELYRQYPELRDQRIVVDPSMDKDALGYYDPNKDLLAISPMDSPDRFKEVLIHEIQHAVDFKEGLSFGANPRSFEVYERTKDQIDEINRRKLENYDKKLSRYIDDQDRPFSRRKIVDFLEKTVESLDEKTYSPIEINRFKNELYRIRSELNELKSSRIREPSFYAEVDNDIKSLLSNITNRTLTKTPNKNFLEKLGKEFNTTVENPSYFYDLHTEPYPVRLKDRSVTRGDLLRTYRANAGEVQARAAGYRSGMDLEARSLVTPLETVMDREPETDFNAVWVEGKNGIHYLVDLKNFNEGGLVEKEDKTLEALGSVETHNRNPEVRLDTATNWAERNRGREGSLADPNRGEYMSFSGDSGLYKDRYFDNSPSIAEEVTLNGEKGFVTTDLTSGIAGPSLQELYSNMLALDNMRARTSEQDRALSELRTFFTNRTGMAEGGRVERDPISGNEVPPGSEPHNVRDDIPAMLSEGEFVIPANVVNYYGVSKFNKMIDEAEAKLEEMDKKGRIGGEGDGMFLGGLFSGLFGGGQEADYPWSDVEINQAPLFNPQNWMFPGISAFWFSPKELGTTRNTQNRQRSRPRPDEPNRDEDGSNAAPDRNDNYFTMDKGKLQQLASSGWNPLDKISGMFGEGRLSGLMAASRVANLQAASEAARQRGFTDIADQLAAKANGIGVELNDKAKQGLFGGESFINDVFSDKVKKAFEPARWEAVYNRHAASAGLDTIPDPNNPFTEEGSDRPPAAGGRSEFGERLLQNVRRPFQAVGDRLGVGSTQPQAASGPNVREVPVISRDGTPIPSTTPSRDTPRNDSGIPTGDVQPRGVTGGFSGRYPVIRVNPVDIDTIRAAGLEPNYEIRSNPQDPTDTVYAMEINPNTYNKLESMSDQLDPNEWNAVKTLMNEDMSRGIDQYVPNTPSGASQPSPPTNPNERQYTLGPEGEGWYRQDELVKDWGQYGTGRKVVMDGVEYDVGTKAPDLPSRSKTVDPNVAQGDRGLDWSMRTMGFPTDVYNSGPKTPPERFESNLDRQIEEALGSVVGTAREAINSIRGAAAPENRPNPDWNAIGERAAAFERGVGEDSNRGPDVMSSDPTQPDNPTPFNEPSPSTDVNVGSGGTDTTTEETQSYAKGGFVQRPVSYAKGGYVTKRKGK